MLSKLMCGAILASAAAGAAAQTWTFNYTGFEVGTSFPSTQVFNPEATISGTFSGSDRNGDGMLSAPELTTFVIHSFGIDGTDVTRCDQGAFPYGKCSLDAFSFRPQDDLAFHVSWSQGPFGDGDVGAYGSLDSGNGESISKYSPGGLFLYTWSRTNDTTLAISAAPVPEPSRAALALAGLLALGLASLSSRRQRRGAWMANAITA